MDLLDKKQQVKLMLVTLAEYLQTSLSDVQVKLYADDLMDIGPEGLAKAIACLKADETVWSGRFPLPAKLKSYVHGSAYGRAVESARRILSCRDVRDATTMLSKLEFDVAKGYGLMSITERSYESTSTIFAQLRELLLAAYEQQKINHAMTQLEAQSERIAQAQDPLRALGGPDHLR